MKEQKIAFNALRDQIDMALRNTGFEEYLEKNRLDISAGRLVVARGFIYTSDLDGVPSDMEPLATRLITEHEVGVMTETPEGGRSYRGIVVSSALNGEPQVPMNDELDGIQMSTLEGSIARLRVAKENLLLPFLTKSLKKIDPAGD